jgi:hypothetical protein
VLARYAREWIIRIEDISSMVEEQRRHARTATYDQLVIPGEEVYPVEDHDVAWKLGLP